MQLTLMMIKIQGNTTINILKVRYKHIPFVVMVYREQSEPREICFISSVEELTKVKLSRYRLEKLVCVAIVTELAYPIQVDSHAIL